MMIEHLVQRESLVVLLSIPTSSFRRSCLDFFRCLRRTELALPIDLNVLSFLFCVLSQSAALAFFPLFPVGKVYWIDSWSDEEEAKAPKKNVLMCVGTFDIGFCFYSFLPTVKSS
jgi:hypothetical protein